MKQNKRRHLKPGFLMLLILIAMAGAIALTLYRFRQRPPVIHSVEPEVASPGDIVVLHGENFGEQRNGGTVIIGGVRPTSRDYLDWEAARIRMRVPGDVESGELAVITRQGHSNTVLFTNSQRIPIVLDGPMEPGLPYIDGAWPAQGGIGTPVTIKGFNFGLERGGGEVFFTGVDGQLLPCSEIDYDYGAWNEQEILVYVPDGATSGKVLVRTDRGQSNSLFFEVLEQGGTKVFPEKAGYHISYGVRVAGVEDEGAGVLDIWLANPASGPAQRRREYQREPDPFWDDYLGMSRYHFTGEELAGPLEIVQKVSFERFAVESRINYREIETGYNRDRKLYQRYTAPEQGIPAGDPELIDTVRTVVGRYRNPYSKAVVLYNYVLRRMSPVFSGSRDVLDGWKSRQGDGYTYAMLYTAMLRAAGVPARPVGGVVVHDNKQVSPHIWMEYYLEGIGWIPVDPAMGDGLRFGNVPLLEDISAADYYFGSLDLRHLAFTRGIVPIPSLLPRSSMVRTAGFFALQSFHEESSGINGYQSYWKPVKVVDWW